MSLDRRLRVFDESYKALLAQMDATSAADLEARPIPGKWSILEIVEHLVIAERDVMMGLPDPSRLVAGDRKAADRIKYQLVLFVLWSGIPVQVPSPRMLPQGGRSLLELRRLWDENRAWLRSCLDYLGTAGASRAVLRHPVAGPLTVPMAIRLGQVHIDAHLRQIKARQRLLR
jgi:hypothetical protein